MARLVLVRNGETEWNRVERFRGRADIGLDDFGKRQARVPAAQSPWTTNPPLSSRARYGAP